MGRGAAFATRSVSLIQDRARHLAQSPGILCIELEAALHRAVREIPVRFKGTIADEPIAQLMHASSLQACQLYEPADVQEHVG